MKRQLLPPVFLFIFLLAVPVVHYIIPLKQVFAVPYTYMGIILIGFGVLMNLWADHLFKKHFTTVKPYERPSTLITSGPFQITRHPMYLGMFTILCGVSVLFGSAMVLIVPVIFVLLMEILFIRHEEQTMEQTFGGEYTVYKKRIHRWI